MKSSLRKWAGLLYGLFVLLACAAAWSEGVYQVGTMTYLPVCCLNSNPFEGGNGVLDTARQTLTITVFGRGKYVFQLGSTAATRDGQPLTLSAAPVKLDDWVYVPLCPALCEACKMSFCSTPDKNGMLTLTIALPDGQTGGTPQTYYLVPKMLTPEELALRLQPVADADARALFNAIGQHQADVVAQLLKAHPALRYAHEQDYGSLPLQFAARFRYKDMVDVLLANGISTEDRDADGNTALHVALNPLGCFVGAITGSGHQLHRIGNLTTNIMFAANCTVEEMIAYLLQHGSNVNAANDAGVRPLNRRYSRDITIALLNAGADVHAEDSQGHTPQFTVNDITLADMMLTKGADVQHRDHQGRTVLHYAENSEIIAYWVAHGLPIEVKDQDGATPLITAAGMGNINTMEALLKNGADANARIDNSNVLGSAACAAENSLAAVKLLLSHGAKMNQDPDAACPALTSACSQGNIPVVKYLLANGAQVNAKQDGNATSPLMMACEVNNVQLVNIFLAAGARVNAKDQDGVTPLAMAKANKNQAIIKLLLAAGAK